MPRPWIASALVQHLRDEWTPPRSVRSERLLDRSLRDHVRRWVRERCPSIPSEDVKRYVAGHEDGKLRKKHWTQSKAHQVVRLWGAGKTSDLFIYHEGGRYGLPKRGISLEIKYVSRKPGEGLSAKVLCGRHYHHRRPATRLLNSARLDDWLRVDRRSSTESEWSRRSIPRASSGAASTASAQRDFDCSFSRLESEPGGKLRGRRARRPLMCAVASAPGAASVRVWEVTSR